MARRKGKGFQLIPGKTKKQRQLNKFMFGLIAFFLVLEFILTHTRFFTTFVVWFISLSAIAVAIFVGQKLWHRNKLSRSGINEIDKMAGREFEERLEVLFTDLGYKVKLTPESGDYGADLVIENVVGKTVVQAKRYSQPVGVQAIQEVTTSMAYYSAKNAIVVTNNYFTPQAKELAIKNKVELWDRDKLIGMLTISNKQSETKVMGES